MVGGSTEGTLPLDGIDQSLVLSGSVPTDGVVAAGRKEIYYGVTDAQVGVHGPAYRLGDIKLIVGKTGGKPGKYPPPANMTVDAWGGVHLDTDAGGVATRRLYELAGGSPYHNGETFPSLDNVTCALYNMSSDEDEHFDISEQHPDLCYSMLARVRQIVTAGEGIHCMDCSDPNCPDATASQVNVTLPNGAVMPAWEPWCDKSKEQGAGL